jgi:hypothetical protein
MRTAVTSSRDAVARRRAAPPGRSRSGGTVDDERRRPSGVGFDFARIPVTAPPTRRSVTFRVQTTAAAGPSDRGCCGTGACKSPEERQADTGVIPVAEEEMGDTGANGGGAAPVAGPVAGPAPATTPAAVVPDCDCCVDDVTISNVKRIDNATHMGHSFDCTIALQYPATMTSGGGGLRPCRLEWWERTNVPYAPGQTAGKWHDMFALIPDSPTLAPWVNRGGRCETSQAVVINDPPALGKRPGRTVTRTLEFDIKVFSASGSSCTYASRNATATQVLNMISGAPDWPGSSFTTP